MRQFWIWTAGGVCLAVGLAFTALPGTNWMRMTAVSTIQVTQSKTRPTAVSPTAPLSSTLSPQPPAEIRIEHQYPACGTETGSYTGLLVPKQTSVASTAGSPDQKREPAKIDHKTSDRAGFGISTSADPEYWAALLGGGWYLDWSVKVVPANFPVHWQMIRVHTNCITPSMRDIRLAAQQIPGQVWIIGNEPDVIWQDNVPAFQYARIYHDLYSFIKETDPTASIAVAGISAPTPLRLKYLDMVLIGYMDQFGTAMPVDWWTIHDYVLREEPNSWGLGIPPGMDETHGQLYEVPDHGRVDLFQDQLIAFRTWMKTNGYQGKPLALTEFGILMPASYGFPPEFVARYLDETFQWLYETTDSEIGFPEDQFLLVQKWAWFSLSDPTYSSANLGDLTGGKLTPAGKKFQDFVVQHSP